MQAKEAFKSQFEFPSGISSMPSLISAELFAESNSKEIIQIVLGTGAPPPTAMPVQEYWDSDWCDTTTICCSPNSFPPAIMNCGGHEDIQDEDNYSRGIKCMLDSQDDTITFDPMSSIETTTSSMTMSTNVHVEIRRNMIWTGNPSMFVNPPVFAAPIHIGGPIRPRPTLGLPMI
jgi:hypothetical protein